MNKILRSPIVRSQYGSRIYLASTYKHKTRHDLDIDIYAYTHQFSDLDEYEDDLLLYSPFKCVGINFNRAFMLRPGEVLQDDLQFSLPW